MLPVKADNLIESLGFGYLELNFSGAAQLNLDLMGFSGVSKMILPGILHCFYPTTLKLLLFI